MTVNNEIHSQGIKCGIKTSSEIGSFSIQFDDNHDTKDGIHGDAFMGYGETYQRRNKSLLMVTQDGYILSTGTFQELVTNLRKKSK